MKTLFQIQRFLLNLSIYSDINYLSNIKLLKNGDPILIPVKPEGG